MFFFGCVSGYGAWVTIVCMSPKQLCVIERNPTQLRDLNLDRLNSRSDAEQTYGRKQDSSPR